MSIKLLTTNKKAWDAFVDELNSEISMHTRKLIQSTDQAEMYRAQGAVMALERLKHMRDKYENG